MIVHPKVRGFICVTAHPVGCESNVRDQVAVTEAVGHDAANGPKRVLVIGASSGYGLASRITAAFGYGAATLGVFFEKPGTETRTGTAGWYNSAAFDKLAKQQGLYSKSINGDAFSHATRERAIELIKTEMDGPIDLLIYSLASPVRKLPDTGEVVRSSLKTIGEPYAATSVDTNRDTVIEASVEPATAQEVSDTIKVMGGEDWALWVEALNAAGVLAKNAKTIAYSYIGTEITWPMYWHGTIGQAKQHLDDTAHALRKRYQPERLQAWVGVMKSVVTQASSAIPVIPLYMSLVFRIMKEKGLHEGTIEQINRLFHDFLYRADGAPVPTDAEGRVRLDDWELREDVQTACKALWPTVTTENLFEITDYAGYKHEFLNLFGFDRDDVDYGADVNTERPFDCVEP